MDANKKKNIILVGNSVELLQYDFGKYIDSFDTVVRFGRGVPTEDNSHAIGKKTDMWITGFLRMGSYHCFPGAEILFNRCRIHLDLIPKKTIPFDNYTDMFSDDELMKIFNKMGAEIGVAEGQRPSKSVNIILLQLLDLISLRKSYLSIQVWTIHQVGTCLSTVYLKLHTMPKRNR